MNMNNQMIIEALEKLRIEARKGTVMRETVRRGGATRMWFRGSHLVDIEIDIRRC